LLEAGNGTETTRLDSLKSGIFSFRSIQLHTAQLLLLLTSHRTCASEQLTPQLDLRAVSSRVESLGVLPKAVEI
jgi:hypothetical protein